LSAEVNTENSKDSQSKEEAPKKTEDAKKTDSYKSDKASIGKIQETVEAKGGKKDEQRAGEEG
jgi:hypothetical protein